MKNTSANQPATKTDSTCLSWKNFFALAAPIGVAAGVLHWATDVALKGWAFPSAWLAGVFTGCPVFFEDTCAVLPYGSSVIGVNATCAGVGFFGILWSYFYLLRLRCPQAFVWAPRRDCLAWLFLCVCAYPVALAANTCRLILAIYIYPLFSALADGRYAGLAHEIAGVLIFLAFLILFQLPLRRYCHANTTITSR